MTTSPGPTRHRYSYEEYLVYERDIELKHEYDDGEIVAMAGGSRRHNALASRISAALENGRKSGWVAFQSDQRVRILATGRATYPDASMVCGPIREIPSILPAVRSPILDSSWRSCRRPPRKRIEGKSGSTISSSRPWMSTCS